MATRGEPRLMNEGGSLGPKGGSTAQIQRTNPLKEKALLSSFITEITSAPYREKAADCSPSHRPLLCALGRGGPAWQCPGAKLYSRSEPEVELPTCGHLC